VFVCVYVHSIRLVLEYIVFNLCVCVCVCEGGGKQEQTITSGILV
jgi:hypothetical protein